MTCHHHAPALSGGRIKLVSLEGDQNIPKSRDGTTTQLSGLLRPASHLASKAS
jgi:hypothetical protein